MVNFDAAFSDLEGGHSVNPHPIFQSSRLGALPTSGRPVRKLPYMRSQRLTSQWPHASTDSSLTAHVLSMASVTS